MQKKKHLLPVSKGICVHESIYRRSKNIDCYNRHLNTIEHLQTLLDTNPKISMEDLHPNFNTNYENKNYDRIIKVQHHHAHMVSCMVEHSLFDRVIAVVFDGTGFGKDNSIWGESFNR